MSPQVTTLRMDQQFKKTPVGEIPVDWEVTTFGEAFLFLRTASNSRDDLNPNGQVGYIHYGDLHTKWRGKLSCDRVELPRIDAAKVEGLPALQNGDLVMADASEDYEGIGVSAEVCNVGSKRIVAGLHTLLLRDKGEVFADGFRGYIQRIPAFRQRLEQIATGVSVYGISKGNLLGVPIPRPPLVEQRKIAEILSAVDDAIETTAAVIEKTRELKKALLHHLFTHGLGHTRFKQTAIGRIPAEWEVVSLGDYVSIKHGWPFKSEFFSEDADAPLVVVCIGNFRYTGGFRFNSTAIKTYTGPYPEEYKLRPGDTLLVMTCQTPGGEILGIPGRIPDDGRVYLHNQRMGKVVVSDTSAVDERYLYWLFLSPSFNRHMVSTASGTKVLHTAPERIESFRFGLPKLKEQKQIADTMESVEVEERSHEKERDILNNLTSGLMSVLLTGQVRVPL